MPTPAPTAAAWREKFERSPKGFGEQELTEEDLRNRERAEYARALLVGAVDAFRAKVRGGQRRGHQPGGVFLPENAGG
mgnify:CR=1 FL=1